MRQSWIGFLAVGMLTYGPAAGASSAAMGGADSSNRADSSAMMKQDTNLVIQAPASDSSGQSGAGGRKNAAVAALLAGLIPGAGQFYTREYVRGALVIGAEAVTGFYLGSNAASARREQVALDNELENVSMYRGIIDSTKFDTLPNGNPDSSKVLDTRYVSTIYKVKADTARFQRDKDRAVAYQAGCWLGGTYLYSILKAIDMTGRFKTSTPKKPVVAGWLSAIPFLGLGQYYNGSLAKAGVVLMTQTSLGCIALTNHMLMVEAEKHLSEVLSYSDYELSAADKSTYQTQWSGDRSKAFTDRNTYLWYFLLFYFYGIFDAVVDAHLHDYPARMRLEPDLEPRAGGGVQAHLRYSF
jgi:hypothetical protein